MRRIRQAQSVCVLAMLATVACSSVAQHNDSAAVPTSTAGTSATPSVAGASAPAQRPAASSTVAPSSATGSAGSKAAAGSGGTSPAANSSSSAAAAGSGAAGSAGAASKADPKGSGIPCEVFQALADACQTCHGRVPTNGAPMSLVEIADFRVISVGQPKIPKSQLALMRIDGSRRPPMPPEGWPITDQDKKTLLDWLRADAPEATADNATCH